MTILQSFRMHYNIYRLSMSTSTARRAAYAVATEPLAF